MQHPSDLLYIELSMKWFVWPLLGFCELLAMSCLSLVCLVSLLGG
jgi:hypothetical protein